MKKKYTKKQIQEAIKYWEKQLDRHTLNAERLDESLKSKILTILMAAAIAQQCDAKLGSTISFGRLGKAAAVMNMMHSGRGNQNEVGQHTISVDSNGVPILRYVPSPDDKRFLHGPDYKSTAEFRADDVERVWKQLDPQEKSEVAGKLQQFTSSFKGSLDDYISKRPEVKQINQNLASGSLDVKQLLKFIRDAEEIKTYYCYIGQKKVNLHFMNCQMNINTRELVLHTWKLSTVEFLLHRPASDTISNGISREQFIYNICNACGDMPIKDIKGVKLEFNGQMHELKQIRPGIGLRFKGNIDPSVVEFVFE